MSIGTIENCNLAELESFATIEIANLSYHDIRLINIAIRLTNFDGRAHIVAAEDILVNLPLIVMNQTVRSSNDILSGPVILFQLEELRIDIHLLEIQDVVDIGSTETIYALCIIANHTNTLAQIGQKPYNLMLSIIGVLVLIDQNELEFLLIPLGNIRMLFQKNPCIKKKVIEIHHIGSLATFEIAIIDSWQLSHIHRFTTAMHF